MRTTVASPVLNLGFIEGPWTLISLAPARDGALVVITAQDGYYDWDRMRFVQASPGAFLPRRISVHANGHSRSIDLPVVTRPYDVAHSTASGDWLVSAPAAMSHEWDAAAECFVADPNAWLFTASGALAGSLYTGFAGRQPQLDARDRIWQTFGDQGGYYGQRGRWKEQGGWVALSPYAPESVAICLDLSGQPLFALGQALYRGGYPISRWTSSVNVAPNDDVWVFTAVDPALVLIRDLEIAGRWEGVLGFYRNARFAVADGHLLTAVPRRDVDGVAWNRQKVHLVSLAAGTAEEVAVVDGNGAQLDCAQVFARESFVYFKDGQWVHRIDARELL